METDFILKPCAGSLGWYEILKPITLPGEWYFEKHSSLHYGSLLQRPPQEYLMCIGCGK